MANWLADLRRMLSTAAGADGLDPVEFVLSIQEVFGVVLDNRDAEQLRTPRMLIEWLCNEIGRTPPNERGMKMLQKVAAAEHRPELARDTAGWHRLQIEAVVMRLIREAGAKSFTEDTRFTEMNC